NRARSFGRPERANGPINERSGSWPGSESRNGDPARTYQRRAPKQPAPIRGGEIWRGGRWITSKEAIERFAESLTLDVNSKQSRPPRPPAARQRVLEKAGRELGRIRI